MASVSGRRDAKSRAASLSASFASIDLSPIVMRTRASESAFPLGRTPLSGAPLRGVILIVALRA
jgi:hypothetical protein